MAESRAEQRVAVVVVNLNGAAVLDRCLRALARQTVRPARVIVVDNASTDGSADGLEGRHPGIEVVRLAGNIGFAAANNLAVRRAHDCEWLPLLNPDAFPEPRWLEALVAAAAERPEYEFFGSRLLMAGEPDLLDGTGDAFHVSGLAWRWNHGAPAAGTDLDAREIFSPCAAAALYRRDAFLEVGGFDEDYFCYFEDTDLSFRLRLVGRRCLYVPDAVVHHVGSALTGRESCFTVFHRQRNLVWAYLKNMPFPLLMRHAPQLVLVHALMVAWHVMSGHVATALRAEVAMLAGLPRVVRQRQTVQRSRVVAAADIAALLESGPRGYRTALSRARTARSTSAATTSAGAGNT